MYNKFKVKKKIISIALALTMSASSVASLPMNVFAGNTFAGKKKKAATTAPHVASDFEIDNIIGLEANKQFDVSNYVKNITPQGATVSYTVKSQTAFADSTGNGVEVASLAPRVIELKKGDSVDPTRYDIKSFFDFLEGKEVTLEDMTQDMTPEEMAQEEMTPEEMTQEGVKKRGNDVVSIWLDADNKPTRYMFKRPVIIHAQETVDGQTRDVYIVVDIDGILHNGEVDYRKLDTAYGAAAKAANATVDNDLYATAVTANAAEAAAAAAAEAAYEAAANAAEAAAAAGVGAAEASSAEAAYNAAANAANDAAVNGYNGWVKSYKSNVDGVVKEIVNGYKAKSAPKEKDWLVAAYAAVKAARKMAGGNGLDLEAKLKIAHMAYRIAQFVWQYDTDPEEEGKTLNAAACETRANALKNMIDDCYEDKVGDIEE